jgi:hypothetical protein
MSSLFAVLITIIKCTLPVHILIFRFMKYRFKKIDESWSCINFENVETILHLLHLWVIALRFGFMDFLSYLSIISEIISGSLIKYTSGTNHGKLEFSRRINRKQGLRRIKCAKFENPGKIWQNSLQAH